LPRRDRCVLPQIPCHITQRGVDRSVTFRDADDRHTYLRLLRDNLSDAAVRILGYCVMTNHVHLIAVPEREDSLAVLLRRVHGRYAQFFNIRYGRTGHLWQNRFFACCLGPSHLWRALAYVERNPARAGLVIRAADYPWSSAAAHVDDHDATGILDMPWWRAEAPFDWTSHIGRDDDGDETAIRRCTYAGKPFGEESFVTDLSLRFGRHWVRGRPTGKPASVGISPAQEQFTLFDQ
jgi:putative transposase